MMVPKNRRMAAQALLERLDGPKNEGWGGWLCLLPWGFGWADRAAGGWG